MAPKRPIFAIALGALWLGCAGESVSPNEQDAATAPNQQDAGGSSQDQDAGSANANLEPSSPECGEVPAGSAPMAYLPDQGFCIDRTEVTWGWIGIRGSWETPIRSEATE